MISNLSIISGMVILIVLVALFFIVKSFSLPSSYFKNQAQREEILKNKIKAGEEQKARLHMQEDLDKKEAAAEADQK